MLPVNPEAIGLFGLFATVICFGLEQVGVGVKGADHAKLTRSLGYIAIFFGGFTQLFTGVCVPGLAYLVVTPGSGPQQPQSLVFHLISQTYHPIRKGALFGALFCILFFLQLPTGIQISRQTTPINDHLGLALYNGYLFHLYLPGLSPAP